MKTKKKYKVYMRWNNGDTLRCICLQSNPACDRFDSCSKEKVTYDKFEGYKDCFKQNKYGK